jgi:hypothetical protein
MSFLKDIVLPHMSVFGPIVFLAELVFAGSMILGLAVRLSWPGMQRIRIG